MKTQKEIWKDIPGYEGKYQASNLGRIRSLDRIDVAGRKLKGIVLSLSLGGNGYYNVTLHYGNRVTKNVHQIIAQVFLNHIPRKTNNVIDHKNFNKLDNRVNNLRAITQRENTNMLHLKSSSRFTGVCWCKKSKKWKSYIVIKNKLKHLGYFLDEIEASKAYQTALKSIS